VVNDTMRCHFCHKPFGSAAMWRGRTIFLGETWETITAGLVVACCSLCKRVRAARNPDKSYRLKVIAQTLKLERDEAAARRSTLLPVARARFPRLQRKGV